MYYMDKKNCFAFFNLYTLVYNKKSFFLLSIISVLLSTGCITEEEISSAEVGSQAVDAMGDVGSYAFDGTLGITFRGTPGDIRGMGDMRLIEEREGEIDLHSRRGHIMMKTIMGDLTVEETYIIDDVEYVKIDNRDWMIGGRNPLLLERYNYLATELELLDNTVTEYAGEETLDGVNCYILKARPDPEKLLDLWGQMEIMGIVNVEDLRSTPVKNFDVRMWISQDDFLLRKTKASAELRGEGILIVMDMVLNFHDHGKEMSIELPDGAKNVKGGTRLADMPSYA